MPTARGERCWIAGMLLPLATTFLLNSCGGGGDNGTGPTGEPPPNLSIVFQQDRDIYSVLANGEGLVNLTSAAGYDGGAAWSSDEELIAFVSDRDGYDPNTGSAGIYAMEPDGSNVRRVTIGNSVAWSPDGRLAVTQEGPLSDPHAWLLVVVNADGSNSVTVTTAYTGLSEQSWSPDGTRLAYRRAPGVYGGVYGNLEVRNADGSGEIVSLGTGHRPYWSPDGTKILFDDAGLYLINPDGTGRTMIAAGGLSGAWSPGGNRILFEDASGLHLINPDGTGQTSFRAGGFSGAWSPDGKYIAFLDQAQRDLYLRTADGTDEWRVTSSAGLRSAPIILGPLQ